MFDMNNWYNQEMMWDWKEDPEKVRKTLYLTVIWWNIIFNIWYYLISWLDWKSFIYKVIDWILWIVSSYPTLSIFVILQLIIIFFQIKLFKIGQLKKSKENILAFAHNANFILFAILLNAALLSYFWEGSKEFWTIWIIWLILSWIFFSLNLKNIVTSSYTYIKDFIQKKEEIEEEVEEEDEIGRYDWIWRYYNNSYEAKEKLPYYRYAYWKIIPVFIQTINQTLLFEQNKLVAKNIIDSENDELFVQADFPPISDEWDMEDFIDEQSFSNNYIKINDTFLAIKLRTKFLNKPQYLIEIWEKILPNQIKSLLEQAPFQPMKKLDEDSDDYKTMINEMKKPYLLFSKISIQKFSDGFYVVLNYSKWYRRLVIFPQMKTLTETLEDEDMEMFNDKPNPSLLFWVKAVGWLLGLQMWKIRHMLFGWESGSGKSVFLNSLLYQILYLSTPSVLKLVLIDPLKVSFQMYKKINNLAYPVSTTPEEANDAINFLYQMNTDRYTFLEALGYEDIYSYNKDMENWIVNIVAETWIPEKYRLPWNNNPKYENLDLVDEDIINKINFKTYKVWEVIQQTVLIYDEFNAFNWISVYEKNDSVWKLIKLWEQARKAGIVLILGTQKISADSVPSALRENIPTRISMTVSSKTNSRAILWEQAENKSDWAFLSWYWDMLIFNKVELDPLSAIRCQWFYVKDEEMIELVKDNLETFWMNDYIYKEWEDDVYSWIEHFYARKLEKEEYAEIRTEKLLEKNNKEFENKKIKLETELPNLINTINKFFKTQRTQLVDKLYLDDSNKNIKISTINFKTEDEMIETFETLSYSNSLYTISTSFIQLQLDTKFLSSPDKLEKIEEKLNLQLVKLKEKITFEPIKLIKKGSEIYQKMVEGNMPPYTLIDNFEISKVKNNYYVQFNFTPWYKQTVIFPTSKSARQELTFRHWDKIEQLLLWNKFIIWS